MSVGPLLPAPGWVRTVPEDLPGFFWARGHGGVLSVVVWLDHRAGAGHMTPSGAGPVELTPDFLATQGVEFWPQRIPTPGEQETDMGDDFLAAEVRRVLSGWRSEADLLRSGSHPHRQDLPRMRVLQEEVTLRGCVIDLLRALDAGTTTKKAAKPILRTHSPDKCAGRHCCIHTPSDHHMRGWPTKWRSDIGVMERICPHGVGHPDPDDAAHNLREGRGHLTVHGCDGCCTPPKRTTRTPCRP